MPISLNSDLAVDRNQVGDGDGGLAARGPQQKVARHGARGAHRQPGVAHRRRSAGRVHAQHAAELARHPVRNIDDGAGFLGRERQPVDQDIDIAKDAVLGRILDPDLVPARVHLLRREHGECGLHALTHLGARHRHDHRIVARDLYPAVEAGLAGLDVEQRAAAETIAFAGEPEADAEEAAADDAADDRLAPGELHDAPARIAAARCTARRMAL